jgi:hypothetical protein
VFLITYSKVLVKVLSVTEERNKTESLKTQNADSDILYSLYDVYFREEKQQEGEEKEI